MARWRAREIAQEKFGKLSKFEQMALVLCAITLPTAVGIIVADVAQLPQSEAESEPKPDNIPVKRLCFLASAGSSVLAFCFGTVLLLTFCCEADNIAVKIIRSLLVFVVIVAMLASIALLIEGAII